MSIVKIKSSKSAVGNLRYVLDGEAHNNKLTNHRFINAGGQNIKQDYGGEYDPMYIAYQFKTSRNHAKNQNKKIQSQHLITSFSDDDFDCSDLKTQSQQALKLVDGALKKRLPPDAQFLSVVQVDGEGSKMHVHTILNSVQTNGRVINTNLLSVTGEDNLRDYFDNSFSQNFEKITGRQFESVKPKPNYEDVQTPNEYPQNKRGSYIWRDDLKGKIRDALMATDSGSLDDFKANLQSQGVTVRDRKAGTGEKNDDGTKQKRDAFTYSFTDANGKQRKAKDFSVTKSGAVRGLGFDFTPDSLQLDLNELQKRSELDADEAVQESQFESLDDDELVESNVEIVHERKLKHGVNQKSKTSEQDESERPRIEPIEFEQFDTNQSTQRFNEQLERDEAEKRKELEAKSAAYRRRQQAIQQSNSELQQSQRPESGTPRPERRNQTESSGYDRIVEDKPKHDGGLEL